ncbi:TPA: hypothetical protein N0F65_001842, partial [Lagenidium giganteum]
YSISATAPTSFSLTISSSASSFFTSFFNTLGAPSTSSLASFKPKPVIARISLMTLILLLASKLASLTSNCVFSSFGSSAAAPPAPLPMPPENAASGMPNFSCDWKSHPATTISKLDDLE